MTIAILLVGLLAATPSGTSPPGAGGSGVETRFTAPPKLTVGDRFDVVFRLRTPHPSLITGPLADSLGPFVMVGEKRTIERRGSSDETSVRASFACFRPGRQVIPPLAFVVSSAQRADTLRTDSVSVNIASVLPADMKDIRELKSPEGFPNLLLWLIPALLLVLSVLAYLAWRLYRRLRTGGELERQALPPWEEALRALDGLPWRDWLAEGDAKRYYYALSEILKRYLDRRFEFDAVEQTTTELLASMRALKLPMRDEMGKFFVRYDLVKYAKWVPSAEESEQALHQVREFVERTRPVEPAQSGGAEPAVAPGAA